MTTKGQTRAKRLTVYPPENALHFRASDKTLEEFLKLHGGTHVALDLELARHVRGRRVLLAAQDLLEVLFGRGDGAVRVSFAVAHAHGSVRDRDEPLAGALDV